MNAKQAAAAAKDFQKFEVEKKKKAEIESEKLNKQHQIDLAGKYSNEFHKEVLEKIKNEASKGLRYLTITHKWSGNDSKIVCETVAKKLANDGFKVLVNSEYVPEYIQMGHRDEGDYSHGAYTSWCLQIRW